MSSTKKLPFMKSIFSQILALSCLTQAVKAGGPELYAVYANSDSRSHTTYMNTATGVKAVKSKTTVTDYTVEGDWGGPAARVRFFAENGQKLYQLESPAGAVTGTFLERPYETTWSQTNSTSRKTEILRVYTKSGKLDDGASGWEHWNARGVSTPFNIQLPLRGGVNSYTADYPASVIGTGLRFEKPNARALRAPNQVAFTPTGYEVSQIRVKSTLNKKLMQTFALSSDATANGLREPSRTLYLMTLYLESKGYSLRNSGADVAGL
jgi:hypothetical protein